jgi:hypothetical protein
VSFPIKNGGSFHSYVAFFPVSLGIRSFISDFNCRDLCTIAESFAKVRQTSTLKNHLGFSTVPGLLNVKQKTVENHQF